MSDATALQTALVAFSRSLAPVGIRSTPEQSGRFVAAVSALPGLDLLDLYWAGRSCLGVRGGQRLAYDGAFAAYFLGVAPSGGQDALEAGADESTEPSGPADGAPSAIVQVDTPAQDGTDGTDEVPRETVGCSASAVERLRLTPFERVLPEEERALRELVRGLRFRPPTRPSRRFTGSHRHVRLDLRGVTRHAMRTGGELILPTWRARRRRPDDVVFLLDVSRSMAPYSRVLLHFTYAASQAFPTTEVVCFGTRVTRLTPLLARHRTARALESAAESVLDWDGGTRITEAVGSLRALRGVGPRLRTSIVVVCSDGLEQGETDELAVNMRRLRATCRSVIWVNPLAGDAAYEPTARGMRAALPFVDALVAGDSVEALRQVADLLSGIRVPVGVSPTPPLPPAVRPGRAPGSAGARSRGDRWRPAPRRRSPPRQG